MEGGGRVWMSQPISGEDAARVTVEGRAASGTSNRTAKITVVVACISPLVGRGVLASLRGDRRLQVVGSELGRRTFSSSFGRGVSPHVVVLGELVEYESLVRVQSSRPAPGVVVIAREPEPLLGPLLLATGVSSLASTASKAELVSAVLLAAGGVRVLVGTRTQSRASTDGAGLCALTKRELEVLACLSEGQSNQQIAEVLHISVETARTHVARILRKLDRHTRRELVGVSVA
jgi:DNA-binding NarL/FixJ family response regulator